DLGHFFYRRGYSQMPFVTGSYPLQPYGQILQDAALCSGCSMGVQVRPMDVCQLDATRHKADPLCPQSCVNCNAWVHRYPQQCLQIRNP
ncbi:MAG: hypothetical protein ACFFCH_10930, partial [Promethearchaeota archaeon]